jgi:hypothetical protein
MSTLGSVAVVSTFRHVPIYRHDISVRNSQQKKKLADSESLLHLCSSGVAALLVDRCLPGSNSLSGWLNACCFMPQIIPAEELVASPIFHERGRIFQWARRVAKQSRFPNALLCFFRVPSMTSASFNLYAGVGGCRERSGGRSRRVS